MIIKRGKFYQLISRKHKKNLGFFKTLKDAKKREQQINYFKNLKS